MRQMLQTAGMLASIAIFASSAIAASVETPFLATLSFSEQLGPPADPDHCFADGGITGSGVASKIGPVTLGSRDCIVATSPTTFMFSATNAMLVSAGGTISLAYSGTMTSGLIAGQYLIVGGTGRYVNATGSGTIYGFESVNTATGSGNGQLWLSGTITY